MNNSAFNSEWGRDIIHLGGQRKDATWQLHRDYLTQQYKTEWAELPSAKTYFHCVAAPTTDFGLAFSP